MATFEFDLDETVRFGKHDISLRTALREYIAVKKLFARDMMLPQTWFRDHGKKPGSFVSKHMDELAAEVHAGDLNASNEE